MGDQQNLFVVRSTVVPARQVPEQLITFRLFRFRDQPQGRLPARIRRGCDLSAGIAVEVKSRHLMEGRNAERVKSLDGVERKRHDDDGSRRASLDERLHGGAESHDRERAQWPFRHRRA